MILVLFFLINKKNIKIWIKNSPLFTRFGVKSLALALLLDCKIKLDFLFGVEG